MHWLLDPILHHYADFKGRTPRKAYWLFILMYSVSLAAFAIILNLFIFTSSEISNLFLIFLLFLIFILAFMLPVIAIHVRRLHDIGFSGWWYLLNFIPYLGSLVIFVMMLLPSQEGGNKYGPHPYAPAVPLPPEPVPVPPPPSEPSLA